MAARPLNVDEVLSEMNKMVAKFKQEALEKDREIKVKANKEFSVAKAKLVKQEVIDAQYGKKRKGAEVAQKIAQSNLTSKSRLKLLHRREEQQVVVASRRKRYRLDLQEEEEEKAAILPDGAVTHAVACGKCMERMVECQGFPGRPCFFCAKTKVGCTKSDRRGRKGEERKGKAIECRVRVPRRQSSPAISILSEEEEEKAAMLPDGAVTHAVACDKCTERTVECQGFPGRPCFVCAKTKVGCTKSDRRGRKGEERKGKATERRVRVTRRQLSPAISVLSSEGEPGPSKARGRRRALVDSSRVAADQKHTNRIMCVVLRMEAKVRSTQVRLKKAEVELEEMMQDLGEVKSALEGP